MKVSSIAKVLFYALLAAAPLGTRYIGYMGNIGGVDIEPGTVSMFGTQIVAILFVVLALVAAADQGGRPSEWKRDPFALAALLIVASVYLSAALSVRFTSGLVEAFWVALGAAVFCAVRMIKPSTTIAAMSLMVGAVIQAFLGAVQFVTQEATANKWLGMAAHLPSEVGTSVVGMADSRWLRAYGTLSHPNDLGMYLAIAAVLALAFAAGQERWKRRLGLAAAIVCAFGLVLTFSRSAAIGFIVGLAALAIPALVCTGKWRPRLSPSLIAATVGLAALVAASLALHEPVFSRIAADGRLERISIEERGTQLDDARSLLMRSPLFGVGPGMMPYAMHRVDSDRDPWDYQYVHNTPLLVAVETGLLGVMAWSLFIFFLVRVACRTAKREAGPGWIPFLPALAVIFVVGLFDHFVWSSWFGQLMFWFMAALTVTSASSIPRFKKEDGRLVVE